jgi:hypothetical protein
VLTYTPGHQASFVQNIYDFKLYCNSTILIARLEEKNLGNMNHLPTCKAIVSNTTCQKV